MARNQWPKAIFYDSKNTLFDWSKAWVQASANILNHYDSDVDSDEFKALWHRLLISENHRTAFSTYREFTEALKESLGDRLKKRCEELGVPDLMDKIADETKATTSDELLAFLESAKHPALEMQPLM